MPCCPSCTCLTYAGLGPHAIQCSDGQDVCVRQSVCRGPSEQVVKPGQALHQTLQRHDAQVIKLCNIPEKSSRSGHELCGLVVAAKGVEQKELALDGTGLSTGQC
mmetsp:Transcript_10712/g.20407  ORF Transcript_10712/g.20407 Transcript_10712/m.20407 type:complete len:105 (+) Transcript_10712:1469-1783(+)